MNKLILHKGILIILVLLIPLTIYIISSVKLDKTTKIFEIKSAEGIFNPQDSDVITVEKHYMITNPPEDLLGLKKLVEDYIQVNPINNTLPNEKNKKRDYLIYFYRESNSLPRDWKPKSGGLQSDDINNHKSDCIVLVAWSDTNSIRKYVVMKKSSTKEHYGEEIDKQIYSEDLSIK